MRELIVPRRQGDGNNGGKRDCGRGEHQVVHGRPSDLEELAACQKRAGPPHQHKALSANPHIKVHRRRVWAYYVGMKLRSRSTIKPGELVFDLRPPRFETLNLPARLDAVPPVVWAISFGVVLVALFG